MMQIIPPDTNFDFVGKRKAAVVLSTVLNVAALLLLLVWGANLGIDFAGGSLVQVRFQTPTEIEKVRAALRGLDVGAIDIQDLGGAKNEFLIRVPLSDDAEGVNRQVTTALNEAFSADQLEILRVEAVGPRVGKDLRRKAVLAVIFATVMMGVYIAFRFEWRFGVGAAIALVHDVLITVGALILFNYEFDLTIIAALLTVVGFSVNDTVVISDRIREDRRKDRRTPLAEVINRAINETLSRTILTTGTAIMVILALYLLGGPVIHGFAFALLVGFVVGVYSTVFVAVPIVLFFERGAPQTVAAAARRSSPPAAASRR